MKRRTHWSCAGLLAGMLAAVGVASAAWACVPQPLIVVQPTASGPPGTQVTVSGTNFPPGPVEIRWNGLEGTKLDTATATATGFSAKATIPAAADGLYTVVGIPRGADGSVSYTVARAEFLVVASPGSATSAAPRPAAKAAAGRPRASEGSSTEVNPFAAAAGGAGLVVIGGVGGALVSRRRRPAAS